jgi:mRNA interferase YafQ
MLKLITSGRFDRELKKIKKRNKDMAKIKEVIELLQAKKTLPVKHRPHKLHGEFTGYWECHIEPDWLLVYKITESELILFATGTHSDLF